MRVTLHLLAAADLSMVIAAMRPSALAMVERWQTRVGTNRTQANALTSTILDALRDGPRTQQELIAAARKKASKGMRAWLDNSSGALRGPLVEGLIVYGPPRGIGATFVRVDQWLPRAAAVSPYDESAAGVARARAELCRRFLSAFGPASAHDFARWSGIKTTDARTVLAAMADDLEAVSIEGATGWIRRTDRPALEDSLLDDESIRLLGPFDSFLLAHATKEHLVPLKHYKRVYRPQGWISPVVLRGGAIIGVWFPESSGKSATLRVELFSPQTPSVRARIEREAEAIGRFLGTPCAARFGAVPESGVGSNGIINNSSYACHRHHRGRRSWSALRRRPAETAALDRRTTDPRAQRRRVRLAPGVDARDRRAARRRSLTIRQRI